MDKEDKVISIGGLGGSGTRAVAEIFIQSGLFMGNMLNESNDNLLFTLLLKNPSWFKDASINEIEERFQIFEKQMSSQNLSINECKELFIAGRSNPVHRTSWIDLISMLNPLKLSDQQEKRREWGWKEPNSHIYLPELLSYFPSLKYVHVLRNGLDMAFSQNKQQLINWGWKYGIELVGDEDERQLACLQLDYWIATTQKILSIYQENNSRIYMLNYSYLGLRPKEEIDSLLDFCQIDVEPGALQALYGIPRDTGSNNRYKSHDLSIFSETQLKFVRDCGFEIS